MSDAFAPDQGAGATEGAAAATLPRPGEVKHYEIPDVVTGRKLTGTGLVVDAYTTGEGKHAVDVVRLFPLDSAVVTATSLDQLADVQ